MASLKWFPQVAFKDFFYTTAEEILSKRTVFREDVDYFVPHGGRGSAKSYSFMDAIVVEASLRPIRILCAREYQISIEESIKAEIEAAIDARGLNGFFRCLESRIEGLNGSKFIFKGIKNNIKNLKSISDVDILVCEEAENITKNSWDKLLPSIRPRNSFGNRGKRPINIIIFNPDDELDDTYQRFIVNPPPRSVIKLINWRDNKYFPEYLDDMRLHSLKTRPLKDHEHDWEGKPKSSGDDVIIDREWVRAARFASRDKDWVHVGKKRTAYDPAGQGKDSNAAVFGDGNIIKTIDEWVKSKDLRKASERAFNPAAVRDLSEEFIYDTCGGLGDGVSVFVLDAKLKIIKEMQEELKSASKNETDRMEMSVERVKKIKITPFDAGSPVSNPKKKVPGTKKTWGEQYSNAKAQLHAITAQKLYNTYRFIVLKERDIDPNDMMSFDIEDGVMFNKIVVELSTPIWVKSATNSKKKVEDKKAMQKRTGQPSPNVGDSIHMLNIPNKGKRFN